MHELLLLLFLTFSLVLDVSEYLQTKVSSAVLPMSCHQSHTYYECSRVATGDSPA